MNAGTIAAGIAPIVLVALAAGLALAPARQEQEAPPATPAYDLRVLPVVGQPMLIEITIDTKRTAELALPAGPKRITAKSKQLRRLVDEFLEIGDGSFRARRRIVTSQETVDGECADDEMNGADVALGFDGKEIGVELLGGRGCAESTIDRLARQALAAAAQLPLPGEARVGDAYVVDVRHFTQLLLALEGGGATAECTLTVESIDAEKQRAKLAGRATLAEKLAAKPDPEPAAEDDSEEYVADHEFELAVEVDLVARRIARARAKGTSRYSGKTGGIAVTGSAEFEATLTTTGADAARKAAAEKPIFREVEHALPRHGVTLRLPSHFFARKSPVFGEKLWLSQLGTDRRVTIGVIGIALGGGAVDEGLAPFEAEVAAENPGAPPFKDVRSALGKGRRTTVTKEGELHEIELYPLGPDRVFRLRVSGAVAAKKAMADELTKFRASLKKLGK